MLKRFRVIKLNYVLTALFLSSTALFGQDKIGYTMDEIKELYSDPKFQLESGKMSDYLDYDGYYIKIQTELGRIDHYFAKNKVCLVTHITPKSQTIFNWYITFYNKNYVIISNTEWKKYIGGSVLDIELVLPENENDEAYFSWSYNFDNE